MTWQPGGPIWSAAVEKGGAGLRASPSGLGWAGLLQCVRLCGLASAGGNRLRGLHSGAGGAGPGSSRVCAGGVCGRLGGPGVPRGVGLPSVGVCGFTSVGGVRGVRWVGPWRACAVVRALGEARVAGPGGARNGGRVWVSG